MMHWRNIPICVIAYYLIYIVLLWEVTNKAGSIIRPLVMDFPKDKKVLDMDTEYMFGRSF